MRYFFCNYVLDTKSHELLHLDSFVKLRPKVFKVLTYLLEHRDRVVPKGELLDTIWPRNVGDEVLNSCVMEIRKNVGDDGRTQGVIKTTHGLGYRFVAPVYERADKHTKPPSSPQLDRAVKGASATSAGLSKEHKIVTVLVCAITRSQALAGKLGPELMHQLMDVFFTHAAAVMKRHEGCVVQRQGDGFLALFGAPSAREDHARRAVLASLELVAMPDDQVSEMGFSSFDVRPSVGLHTGPIVVGELEDNPASQFYTARGEITDFAIQLQSCAAAGTVQISERTYLLVEKEVAVEPSAQSVGMATSYQLRGIVHRRAGVLQTRHGLTGQFVGRSQELALLNERFDRAKQNDGQITGVSGVAGIGKSRLIDEFCFGLPRAEVTVLKGHCLPYGTGTPYLPFVDLVRDSCALSASDNGEQTLEKVRTHLNRTELTQQMELLLLEFLGIPIDSEPLKRLSPQARRAQTFRLLQNIVLSAAMNRPTVLIIEDIHWIDATSESWLSQFVTRLGDRAILLLLTYRPPYNPEWLDQISATRLALPALTQRDSAVLIRSILNQPKDGNDINSDLVAKAEGNPFFLEELIHALDMHQENPQGLIIPDTIQAVLASRIDRLDAQGKQLLQTCSVMGTPIAYEVLRHVVDLNTETLDLCLGKLEEAGFLFEIYQTPERTYRFKHALTQESAYSSLPEGFRKNIHSRIAKILEDHFDNIACNKPEVLARHHTGAGNVEAAVHYWQRAGRNAYERSANIESVGYSSKGLEILQTSDRVESRTKKELSLQLTLAPALVAIKGYGSADVEPVYLRARSLCEEGGDTRQLFRVLVGLWNFYWVRGEFDTARDVAHQLLNLAEKAKDNTLWLRAHAAMGELLFHTGELNASHRHLQKGIEYARATSQSTLAAQIPEVVCLCYAAWAHWHGGLSQQSQNYVDQAFALASELSHPMSLAVCYSLKAELHQFRLEVDECLKSAEQAVAVSREQELPFWEGTAMVMLGWAQAMAGDFKGGHQTMEDGLSIFVNTGARVQRSTWIGMFADIYNHNAQYDKGLGAVEEGLAWVNKTGEKHYHSELHRLKGRLLLNIDRNANAAAAEKEFLCAVEIARQQGARMREIRAAINLAALWRDQGRTEEAIALFHPHQAWLGEVCDSIDVRDARALLDTL